MTQKPESLTCGCEPTWSAGSRLDESECQYPALQAENQKLREERDEAVKALLKVESLMDQSYGVAGLHLNGEDAPWSELRTGGRFEEWLVDVDTAVARLTAKGEGL